MASKAIKNTIYLSIIIISALIIILIFKSNRVHFSHASNSNNKTNDSILKPIFYDSIQIINQTFLGNFEHNYYGDSAPSSLNIIWKKHLGTGKTIVGSEIKEWAGAGWTGQPLMIKEKDKTYIIQGSYSHKLRKIDAENGNFIWEYKFDDVIKGTGSIWLNSKADTIIEKFVILQGSRKGNDKTSNSNIVPSFRAVSYFSGNELWRYNSVKTDCYSRDVDGSAIFINDTAYIGLENGKFLVFNPNYKSADTIDGILQPHVFEEHKIYDDSDKKLHGNNLVTEASVTKLKNRIYIASGSGHLYGYNLKTHQIDWDFFTGSDIDGTPVVSHDSCLIVAIEKEYIKGQGGVFKLNPDLSPDSCVIWYFPTENKGFHTWQGGVIGSATVNDYYNKEKKYKSIAVFTSVDGNMYVIDKDSVTKETVLGPNLRHVYYKPHLIYKYPTGPAIATPIIVQNKIIAPTYHGVYLFEFDEAMNFKLLSKFEASFEATPFVDNGKIYLASRNGFLYCFGNKN
jgi:outer membrane protein assembly factor BamB